VTSSLHKLLADGTVRYSQVWEDHALVEEGLAVGPGDDVLSIASAGCNALSMLLREPKSVLAIDLNPVQVALVELKLRAIETLTWENLLGFLGIAPHENRVALYERVRPQLGNRARAYWDTQEEVLAAGVHWSGRLEAFFRGFYAEVLPSVPGAATLTQLLQLDDPAAQTRLFDRLLGSAGERGERGERDLRSAFTSYFTRERLASEGRDPRQMRYVEAMDVAGFFWDRFRWVLTALPARGNFYLHSFLTGRYADLGSLPPYLRRENHARLRSLLPRMSVELVDVEGALHERPVSTFSKTNLSDLFEYLSDEATDALFATIGERLRAGGRACFWNLLVPREPARAGRADEAPLAPSTASSASARNNLRPLEDLSRTLYARDRSWFYRAFHIEEVSR
jgi:S-adenosylmethionine-diacylglycerol 3-amino-3-carboxypropyl transferase